MSGAAASTPSGCRLFARACSYALFMDYAVPRPGLSSPCSTRSDPGPEAFAALAPRAYEACLNTCRKAYEAPGDPLIFLREWAVAVTDTLAYGNAGMGSVFLLALQAWALGRALARSAGCSVEAVMGEAHAAVRSAGVEGAVIFYRVLRAASPSYLARISYSGLPDASTSLAEQEVAEKRLSLDQLLREASIYDPVSKDAYTGLALSLATALPVIDESASAAEGVKRATYLLAALEEDLLLKRKLGDTLSRLWWEAYQGARWAEEALSRLLGGQEAGPGSAADIVVNALAHHHYRRTACPARGGGGIDSSR